MRTQGRRFATAVLLASAEAFVSGGAPAQSVPLSRDPWLWPFSDESIWNMPIGSDARYEPANFEDAAHVGVDIQHLLVTRAEYPERKVLDSPTWGPGRCSGTTEIGLSFRVPDNWIVPDAGNSPYGNTPNSNYALLLPDGENVFQGCKISRCVAAGPIYLPEWMKYPGNQTRESIRGDGLDGGGQGASGMSSLGGTVRLGEFVGEEPIRHAIKINPWAQKYCYYSSTIKGYRWPAKKADGYAATTYGGSDPRIVMGSLFAIPPEVTEESLGLTTTPGRKLFFALQNHGAYFTEDAAWDIWDIIVERDAEIEFKNEYGFSMGSSTWLAEVNKLMKALYVVDNNGPESVGGGGTPRQPLAPPFADEVRVREPQPRSSPIVSRHQGHAYNVDGRVVRAGGWCAATSVRAVPEGLAPTISGKRHSP